MKSYRVFLLYVTSVVFLGGGCATVLKQPEGLATATPERMAQLRASLIRATTMRTLEAPSLWAQQRRWSPRRYFGPLYGKSPDVHLNGEQAAFVYNRFFTGHPDITVFQKYYGLSLPGNQPSLAEAIPGTLPSAGFRDARLGFDGLTYSSRYGGSFKLTFRSLEDYQVEYRKGDAAWDIASLEVVIYVRPVPGFFNPNQPFFSVPQSNVHVEFRPHGVIGYILAGGTFIVQEGDPLPGLLIALAETARTIAGGSGLRLDATRFSHGLIHAEFWDDIGHTNNVEAIEISDGFFFPRTSAGRPVAVVHVRASNVNLDTEVGSEEIFITIHAGHRFRGVSIDPSFSWELPEIDNHQSTGWCRVGAFPLDWDCGQLETVFLMVSVREDDDVFDDEFLTNPLMFETGALDCVGMQAAFNNGQFGLYENLPDQHLDLVEDDEVAGALTINIRIDLVKQ